MLRRGSAAGGMAEVRGDQHELLQPGVGELAPTGRSDLESTITAGPARPGGRGGALPEGILRGSYEALARGDAGPLLAAVPASFEWAEPDLPGYPLAGVHRGPSGLAKGVLAPLAQLLD